MVHIDTFGNEVYGTYRRETRQAIYFVGSPVDVTDLKNKTV